jgi:hypothetical protein
VRVVGYAHKGDRGEQSAQAVQTVAQDTAATETDERKKTRLALDRLRERTARLFDL